MERTSLNSPLRLGELKHGRGCLGLTLCPGKKTGSVSCPDRPWNRDIDDDLDILAFWGCSYLLTLITDREMDDLGLLRPGSMPLLARGALDRKMSWYHVPILDKGVPEGLNLSMLYFIADEIEDKIKRGRRIVVHCNSGLGRAGMVGAMFLVRWGERPEKAIERVRDVRGVGAIETPEQVRAVFACQPF